jgi:hypothetical protein
MYLCISAIGKTEPNKPVKRAKKIKKRRRNNDDDDDDKEKELDIKDFYSSGQTKKTVLHLLIGFIKKLDEKIRPEFNILIKDILKLSKKNINPKDALHY